MLVWAVEAAEDSAAGGSVAAVGAVEEALGLRVVGVGLGLLFGAAVEESVAVVGEVRRVLRVLLGAEGELGLGDVLVRGSCELLVEIACLERVVLEVVLAAVLEVVL